MKKVEFGSQVCTTVGQSERLLELGLGMVMCGFDYDYIIKTIQGLIECGYINKVYLED